MSLTSITVLSLRVWSFSSRSLMIFPSQPHCGQPLHGVLGTKSSKYCPQAWAAPTRKGPSQQGSHQMQISQMGFGQGGEKTQQVYQTGYWWGTTGSQPATNEVKNKGHIVIPYTQGLCESIKKICGRYGIQTHFKGGRTIKSLLVSPKDKGPYGQPKWCHLLVPMWWPRLWWGIHRGNLQDLWWKIQRAPEGPLSHSSS